ncbi:hypothetical protein KTH_37590 [Thermosporothrix hazakensis]|nr:hypothetical protein KTH_37590 [Thermosporothrix hazakensis]
MLEVGDFAFCLHRFFLLSVELDLFSPCSHDSITIADMQLGRYRLLLRSPEEGVSVVVTLDVCYNNQS